MKSDLSLFYNFNINDTVEPILLKFKRKCPALSGISFKVALTTMDIYFVGLSEDKIVVFDSTKFNQAKQVTFLSYDEIESIYLDFVTIKMSLTNGEKIKVGLASTNDKEMIEQFSQIFNDAKKGIPQRELYYFPVVDGKIVIDKTNKKVKFTNGKIISWDTISDIEVLTNDGEIHRSGIRGVMSAVAGGVIAGGIGAIIGASLSSKKTKRIVYSIEIIVKTNDLNDPIQKIIVLNKKVKTETKEYDSAMDLLHKLCASFEIVIGSKN